MDIKNLLKVILMTYLASIILASQNVDQTDRSIIKRSLVTKMTEFFETFFFKIKKTLKEDAEIGALRKATTYKKCIWKICSLPFKPKKELEYKQSRQI